MAKRKYTLLPYIDKPTHNDRYDVSRSPIDRVVIHTMVGSEVGTSALFASKPQQGKETSAHYGVTLDGKIIGYLEEYYTAYHCGNYSYNQRSVGIEHEDKWDGKVPEPIRTDILYKTSAQLVADICKFYSIPIDRKHILKHKEVPGSATACPDKLDIDRIVSTALLVSQDATIPAPTSPQNPPQSSNCEDKLKVATAMITDLEARINVSNEQLKKASDEAVSWKASYDRAAETLGEKEKVIIDLSGKIDLLKSRKYTVSELFSMLTNALKERRW